jgi:hypothetical protein
LGEGAAFVQSTADGDGSYFEPMSPFLASAFVHRSGGVGKDWGSGDFMGLELGGLPGGAGTLTSVLSPSWKAFIVPASFCSAS